MTPAELSRAVLTTVRRAVDAAELLVEVPEKVIVQRPPRPGCGDYATNVALQLAGPAGRTPYEIAQILGRRLAREPGIAQVEIAGAGFLNITLDARAYGDVVRQVRAQREAYGHGEGLADDQVTVAADPRAGGGAVRGRLVAEVVNALLRVTGARPAPPGRLPEALTVAEPVVEPVIEIEYATGPTVGPAAGPAPDGEFRDDPETPGTPPAVGAPTTVHEALAALGPDAARWALLRPPVDDTPLLTGTALLAQREANPLFRVRYAHARTRALLRNAHDLGVDPDAPEAAEPPQAPQAPQVSDPVGPPDASGAPAVAPAPGGPSVAPAPATPDARPTTACHSPYHPAYHPAETELLGLIADFPRVIETAARRRGPDRVARHLERLADAFLRFHDECPPLPKGEEKPSAVHAARIRLADATGIVLADGLRLLGISAPDRI